MYNSNITIRIRAKDKEKLKRLTEKDEETISHVLRLLIKKYFIERGE